MTTMPAASTVDQDRLIWLDALRGLTLVLVVVGHVARGLHAAGMLDIPAYLRMDATLYSLHLPLLFVLSGYTFRASIAHKPFGATWKGRLLRIVRPYLVWTFITAGVMFALSTVVNQPLSAVDFLWILLLTPILPYSIFWFFYALIQCQSLLGWVAGRWTPTDKKLGLLALALAMVGQVLQAAFGTIEPFLLTVFLKVFLFFTLGYLLAGRPELLGPRLMLAAGFAALACWSVFLMTEVGIEGPFGLLTGLAGCVFLFALLRVPLLWPVSARILAPIYLLLAFLGVRSIEIFVMHVLFNGAARVFLNAAGIHALGPHILFGSLAGVFGPIAAGFVLKKLKLSRALGL